MVFEEGCRLQTIRENTFRGCAGLERVRLPEELVSIGCCAFFECGKLKSIRFPDRLEKICARCFEGSGLEEVALPASAKEVGANAFYKCK